MRVYMRTCVPVRGSKRRTGIHRRSWPDAAGRWKVRAGAEGAPDSQITAKLMESMRTKIESELEAQVVRVADVSGDGRHVNIDVVSNAFEGKSSVARQRMVYKAIWQELQDVVHAVDAMTCKTPGEIKN